MPTSETAKSSSLVEAGEEDKGDKADQVPEAPTSKVTVESTPQLEEGQFTVLNESSNQLSGDLELDLAVDLDNLVESADASENADSETSGASSAPFTQGVSIISPSIISTVTGALPTKVVAAESKSSGVTQNVFLTNLKGSEPVVLTDAQLKNLQNLSKRTLNSSGSGGITKVIITKNPTTNQPQAVPSGTGSVPTIMFSSANTPHTISLGQSQTITLTPTKTFPAGSLLSPTKLVQGSPSTPSKSLLSGNKLTFSPGKSPQKITMIPVSSMSPQKIAPTPGQVITMVTKSLLPGTSIASVTTSTPTPVALSPSKLIIQKPGGKQIIAQQLNPKSVSGVSSVRPLSVAGSKFQYVRLVAAPSGSQNSSQGRPLAPATLASTGQTQMKLTVPVAGQSLISPQTLGANNQRRLLPATPVSQPIAIRPALPQLRPSPGTSSSLTQLPPGTTFIQGQNLPGVQRFAIVPTQYVTQIQQTIAPAATTSRQDSNYVPVGGSTAASETSTSSSKHNVNGSGLSGSSNQRPRKPCNCTKSQCLKLYCDCFANGEFCHNCNCNNCFNNLEHEDERGRAIKACLDRNPQAFHPKIGKGKQGQGVRRHTKGCNCKRSGCLKNYCECYEAKILCSNLCKCVGCKNFEESPDRKTLMHLADAADLRVQQQTAAKSKLSSQVSALPNRVPQVEGERLPYTFVTKDVAEATCSCLLAQAEECERTRQLEIDEERMILEEFGRCLIQVIQSANKTKDETH